MKIYIGTDHRGFSLKQEIVQFLAADKHEIIDLGATTLDPTDDYPIYAHLVADAVTKDPEGWGILLCGSGVGVEIVANKIDGIRAATGMNAEQVAHGRTDDNMNVLIIAADFVSTEDAKSMITAFLTTPFSGQERHTRRLEEIKKIEQNN